MTPSNELSAEKIGQIALMHSMVSQLPTADSILSFSIQGLKQLPGVRTVNNLPPETVLNDNTSNVHFAISHRQQVYALFEFILSDPSAFSPYHPYVENFCAVLALIFEERRQRTEKQNLMATLEQRVAERTQALQQEIQERKHAENELRRSEGNLRITLDSIGDAVIATDTEGKVTRMNPVAETLTGWPQSEASGLPLTTVFNIINAATRQTIDNPVDRVLITGQVVGLKNHTVLLHRNGSEYQIADSAAPIRSDDGTIQGVVLVFRDITEEYAIHEQLKRSEKMSAVGQLAGGIAHDFNNQLTGILGYADILIEELTDPTLRDFAKDIRKAAQRSAELTAQLLAFGRKGKYHAHPIDPHEIIADTIKILERSIDKRIRIECNLSPEKTMVMGDSSQLQNAILNIALNARDAMPNGGTLRFQTSSVQLDERFCNSHKIDEIPPGDYIEISISDTGDGMNQETQKHIFEPFFTTKEIGKGTGMGLAGAYGTMRSHHGAIAVHSKPGHGTVMRLYLPRIHMEYISTEKTSRPTVGHAAILLVDDEDLVRKTAEKMLCKLGHKVITCTGGHDAIKFYKQSGAQIDLVILDMIMPDLNGKETAQALSSINPQVRILISSGYSQNDEAGELDKLGIQGFISKPFSLTKLSNSIANALETPKIHRL
ncbi:MAG: response regulator [Pontiellaceae bacterium]|nr:response regulator [Pontiellaceae bacterium]MBN2786404.1 response regulator [Pontiellaceae bacterium]